MHHVDVSVDGVLAVAHPTASAPALQLSLTGLAGYLGCTLPSPLASPAAAASVGVADRGPLWLFGSDEAPHALTAVLSEWLSRFPDDPGSGSGPSLAPLSRLVVVTGGVGAATPPLLSRLSPDVLEFPAVGRLMASHSGTPPLAPHAKAVPTASLAAAVVGTTVRGDVTKFVGEADVFVEVLAGLLAAKAPRLKPMFITADTGDDDVAARVATFSEDSNSVLVLVDDASTHTGQNVEYGVQLLTRAGFDPAAVAAQCTAFQRAPLMRRTVYTISRWCGAHGGVTPAAFPTAWSAVARAKNATLAASVVRTLWAEWTKLWAYRTPEGAGYIDLPPSEAEDATLTACWTACAARDVQAAVESWCAATEAAAAAGTAVAPPGTSVTRMEQLPLDTRWPPPACSGK